MTMAHTTNDKRRLNEGDVVDISKLRRERDLVTLLDKLEKLDDEIEEVVLEYNEFMDHVYELKDMMLTEAQKKEFLFHADNWRRNNAYGWGKLTEFAVKVVAHAYDNIPMSQRKR